MKPSTPSTQKRCNTDPVTFSPKFMCIKRGFMQVPRGASTLMQPTTDLEWTQSGVFFLLHYITKPMRPEYPQYKFVSGNINICFIPRTHFPKRMFVVSPHAKMMIMVMICERWAIIRHFSLTYYKLIYRK